MIRVWMVEDNVRFRDAVIHVINEREEMRCDHAFGSCEALLEELSKAGNAAAPNVVLLDIRLPGLSGLEAIAAIKAQIPDSQVIMLTMFDDQERIFRALRGGASGYLLKTSREAHSETIPAAILEAASGGVPMSPSIARSVLSLFARLGSVPEDHHLTERESAVLKLMVDGLIKKEIAERLELSFHTVDGHLRRIYQKLHVNNAPSAVAKAVRERLV